MDLNTPLIFLEIDTDDMESGVQAISFVDAPATEISWKKFSEQKHLFELKETERILTGPIMLANTPIPRFSQTVGMYNVQFTERTILSMMKKYFKENKIHMINEQHDSKRKVNGVYMIESFIINDRTKSQLFNLPNGTWMATFYVEDEDYWNDVIMKDTFTGFSLEGLFSENWENQIIEQTYSKIMDVLDSSENEVIKEYQIKQILNIK
jgi:hypothetical protein